MICANAYVALPLPSTAPPHKAQLSAEHQATPAFTQCEPTTSNNSVISTTTVPRALAGEINVVLDTPGRFFLSGRRLVALVPHSPGARFQFRLPVAPAGRYRVLTRSFHSVSSQSLWQMEINGHRSEHDFMGFYSHFPGVGLAQNELDDWGVFDLSPEANRVVLLPREDYAKKQSLTNYLYCVDAFLLVPEE